MLNWDFGKPFHILEKNHSLFYAPNIDIYPQLEILQIKDCATVALFCGENSTKSALDAVQILGGNGYINDYPTGQILLMEEE